MKIKKGERGDSNPQPLEPQSSALPVELLSPHGAPGGTRTPNQWIRNPLLYPVELRALLSGRVDSNHRPPAPKAGALSNLRYAPKVLKL